MPCMNLGKRLQPAKKAWKIFTTTLHTKLRKLNASKSIKKSKTRIKPTSKTSSLTIFSSQVHHQRKRKNNADFLRPHRLSKKSSPVYIDELFTEPVVSSHTLNKGKGSTSSEKAKFVDPYVHGSLGKREKVITGIGETSSADYMWESLQLASPLMHGIDERADEFIARIKAEMHLQDTIAQRL